MLYQQIAPLRLIETDLRDSITDKIAAYSVAGLPQYMQAEIRWGHFGWGFFVAEAGHSLMMPLYPPNYFTSPEAALEALTRYL